MKDQEQAIRDIIQKYGETINLKKSPYLIGEIIRNYSSFFIPGTEVSSGTPGSHGAPPPPPPGPSGIPFIELFREIQKEFTKFNKSLKKLDKKIDKLR